MKDTRKLYTSRLATIITLVGVAVGLGNVWRFPYMMGKYGGSAFLAVYLVFTILFAIPALMAEMALGRQSRGGTLTAFRNTLGKTIGSAVGFLLLITIMIAASYYAVVVGNVLFTTIFSIFYGFQAETIPEYNVQLSNGWLQYVITLILVSAALFVVNRGLKAGIELVSKIIVPFFLITILYLIFYALMLPGAIARLGEFLQPDLTSLTATQIFAALGQSFFSVGLGGTFMVVYGSYLSEKESIPKIAIATCLGDASAALLASLFLVPTILVFGLDIASGPGLIFSTLPQLFGQMPTGRVLGSLFLLALSSVAFLSMIAAYEVIVSSVDREVFSRIRRGYIIIAVGVLMSVLTLPSSLYPSLIGTLDLIFGSGMQIFGSILAVIGIAFGLRKDSALSQIFGEDEHPRVIHIIFFWIKWVVPAILLSVLLGYIYTVL